MERNKSTCNKDRCKKNLEILDGRFHGEYYKKGQPRGGTKATEEIERIRYIPEEQDIEATLAVMGLTETGERIPFEELRAAVRPVVETVIVTRDKDNRPISRTVTVYDAKNSL